MTDGTVLVPGFVVAKVSINAHDELVVDKLMFTPSVADPGYRGDSAFSQDDPDLDVNDHDGDFWEAMRDHLSAHPDEIGWEE